MIKTEKRIFVFSSKSKEHVQIAAQEGKWAVSPEGNRKRTQTMGLKYVSPGDIAIFYISRKAEAEMETLTLPSIILEVPRVEVECVDEPWPGTWMAPFRIQPLGRPDITVHKNEFLADLPVFRKNRDLARRW